MADVSRIEHAPRDDTYVRIERPNGGFVLDLWCRDAWRFTNGSEVNFAPTHFLPIEGARVVGRVLALRFAELFRRQRWPGWEVWGNEADKFAVEGGS